MSVRFTSTRDRNVMVDFPTALLKGQPPDGGLFIPTVIPEIDRITADRFVSVADLAHEILPRWISADLLDRLDLDQIFSFPIREQTLARDGEFGGFRVVELFHGPTGSFKDFGARFLAACLARIRRQSDRPAVVVVATSGDTGSAVADAFARRAGIGVAILYPKNGVSKIQEAQLTARRQGVSALAVEGSFDDCQRAAKKVLADGIPHSDILSANSINIGRLLPQMLFYLERSDRIGSLSTFVVPCGNLGNLTAGLLARASAMPTARFLAATNSNDYFARFLQDSEAVLEPLKQTLSNAMDVAEPSNLERIRVLWPESVVSQFLEADAVGDSKTRETMRRVYETTGYVADPHTAVALAVAARARRRSESPKVEFTVIATADPSKFDSLVRDETGVDLSRGRFSGRPETPARTIRPDDIPDAIRWVASNVT